MTPPDLAQPDQVQQPRCVRHFPTKWPRARRGKCGKTRTWSAHPIRMERRCSSDSDERVSSPVPRLGGVCAMPARAPSYTPRARTWRGRAPRARSAGCRGPRGAAAQHHATTKIPAAPARLGGACLSTAASRTQRPRRPEALPRAGTGAGGARSAIHAAMRPFTVLRKTSRSHGRLRMRPKASRVRWLRSSPTCGS